MHGLSNDFVIIDGRNEKVALPKERIVELADRKSGIGFDQLVIMKPPKDPRADVFMVMYNADGSSLEACGNASRCVASLLMQEREKDKVILQTVAGLLDAKAEDASLTLITVDMGEPKWDWQQIPLAEEQDTLSFNIEGFDACAVNIGNPHCVLFVEDPEQIDIGQIGPCIENHKLFPNRINVEFISVKDPSLLRMRVWERGAGVTAACGSGACASVVAAVRRGLINEKSEVHLDGGRLTIEFSQESGRVLMTGPASYVFEGMLEL